MIDFFAQKCNANTFKTTVNNYLTLKICDKILQSIARRFDVSRTSLPSECKITKWSVYSEEMNEFKKALKVKQSLALMESLWVFKLGLTVLMYNIS